MENKMGLYLSNYTGPVIFAESTFETKQTTRRVCPNEACNRKKNIEGAFCGSCGTKIVSVPGKEEKVQIPTNDQVQTAFKEAGLNYEAITEERFGLNGVPEEISIYTPNNNRNNPRKFSSAEPKNLLLDIEECDVAGDKAWLAEKFAPEIAVLKELYKSIEIKWVFWNSES